MSQMALCHSHHRLLFDAEEESHSQSECEMEDSTASPRTHSAAGSSAVKATTGEEQSDDSTDVEDSETIKPNVHAGDGDKAEGTELHVFVRCISLYKVT